MKKIIFILTVTSLLLSSCINRDSEPEEVVSADSHPELSFTAVDSSINGSTVNEGDALTIFYKATLSKPLSFDINIGAKQVGGSADSDDFTAPSGIIPAYSTEGMLSVSIIPDATIEETETLELEFEANNIYNQYEVNQINSEVLNLTIDNCATCITCDWVIEMHDTYGDGWNGAKLTFTMGSVVADYTLVGGSDGTLYVAVPSDTDISVEFVSGSYDEEISYEIYDSEGNLLYSDIPDPVVGEVITNFNNVCP